MDKNTKVYVVVGYMNSGSGSLTFPEDFDIIGAFTDEEVANQKVTELNPEENEDGDLPEDEMVYEVWDTDLITKN